MIFLCNLSNCWQGVATLPATARCSAEHTGRSRRIYIGPCYYICAMTLFLLCHCIFCFKLF